MPTVALEGGSGLVVAADDPFRTLEEADMGEPDFAAMGEEEARAWLEEHPGMARKMGMGPR